MKKVILASVLTVSALAAVSNANAAASTGAYCTAANVAGNGAAGTVNTATDQNFIKTGFTPKCSANTHVTGERCDDSDAVDCCPFGLSNFRLEKSASKGALFFCLDSPKIGRIEFNSSQWPMYLGATHSAHG